MVLFLVNKRYCWTEKDGSQMRMVPHVRNHFNRSTQLRLLDILNGWRAPDKARLDDNSSDVSLD